MRRKEIATAVKLSTRLSDPQEIPYFLWNEPMTVAKLKTRLKTGSDQERFQLLALILREARDIDVWLFTTPQEVARLWPNLAPRLGRRRPFWEFLMGMWERQGVVTRAGIDTASK